MRFFNKNLKKDETKSIEKDIGFVEEVFELNKNLISIESHAFSSFVSTKNEKWLELSKEMRKIRTYYLNLITRNEEGQSWCCLKHLCEVAMRLQETYTRFLSIGDKENAKRCAEDYEKIYMKFLELNGYLEGKSTDETSA